MSRNDAGLRLRPWAALLMFVSAYAPLLIILIIKDYDAKPLGLLPRHPILSLILLAISVFSCIFALRAVSQIQDGLSVEVTKAANKSGEMFGYTVPYMLSFMRIDIGDWQTLLSLAIFLGMMFVVAYRTQTVFVNPVLALAGYMLIDCTFKRGENETQAMVITREPIKIGETYMLERLSYYLYAVAHKKSISDTGEKT